VVSSILSNATISDQVIVLNYAVIFRDLFRASLFQQNLDINKLRKYTNKINFIKIIITEIYKIL
jgi:hypothetical protein